MCWVSSAVGSSPSADNVFALLLISVLFRNKAHPGLAHIMPRAAKISGHGVLINIPAGNGPRLLFMANGDGCQGIT